MQGGIHDVNSCIVEGRQTDRYPESSEFQSQGKVGFEKSRHRVHGVGTWPIVCLNLERQKVLRLYQTLKESVKKKHRWIIESRIGLLNLLS
jgi:hypothetical protein